MNRAITWSLAAPLAIGVALAVGPGVAGTAMAAESHCDRTCMRAILDRYFEAVFKHDPSAAPLAANARATENAVDLANGSGIWLTATALGPIQRRYFDTTSGQVAYYGIINEGAEPAVASLRLKIEKRRITEAEWTVARKNAGGMFSPDGLSAQPPPPDNPIPKSERSTRAQLIAAADAYFDGLQNHDGSHVPHIEGCDRVENGVRVTNRSLADRSFGGVPGGPPNPANAGIPGAAQEVPRAAGAPPPGAGPAGGPPPAAGAPGMAQEARSGDCTAGFEMFARTIAAATHRRYPVVDEEAGVVMSMTLFHRPPGVTLKRNLLTEYFWEKQGKISAIYAAMYYLDPSAPDSPGW
jgi:hypothetical protein